MNRHIDLPSESHGEQDELKLLPANFDLYLKLRRRNFAPLASPGIWGFAVLLNLLAMALALLGDLFLGGILEIVAAVGTGISGAAILVTSKSFIAKVRQYRQYGEEVKTLLALNESYLEALEVANPEKAKLVASTYRHWTEILTLPERAEHELHTG